MSATAVKPDNRTVVRQAKDALHAMLPRPVRAWRDERYHWRYGEIELHLLEFLCSAERDSIDVGANEGGYVLFMRKYSKGVTAFEPLPWLACKLKDKFGASIVLHETALSDVPETTTLRVPVVNGVLVEGCASIGDGAKAYYDGFREIAVRTECLDDVFKGRAGFIKIDVEGHEEAVLKGGRKIIARDRPNVLVEILEHLAPGGIARIIDFFRALSYSGFFVYQHEVLPIAAFDGDTMQNPKDAPDLTATLAQQERFGKFVCNFIFLPDETLPTPIQRMSACIAAL